MASDVQFDISGLKEAHRRLRSLGEKTGRRGARFAARKGAKVIANAAEQGARRIDDPATPNSIADNIAIKSSAKGFRRTGKVIYRIGVLGGAASYANDRKNRNKGRAGQQYATAGSSVNPGGDTFYWRFKEFGTEHMPPDPFMRPALENNIGKATDEFARELNKWLDRNAGK